MVACRRRYYCEPSQWWSHLRYLFAELLREFGNEGELRDRIVLTSFQRPGKSEGRALADFTKANSLRHIDAFFSQHGLDGRTIVARRVMPTDRCVGSESQVIPNEQARAAFEAFARQMGSRLWAEYPLGWPPGALLVAFPHDVPNNSLPLLWKNEPPAALAIAHKWRFKKPQAPILRLGLLKTYLKGLTTGTPAMSPPGMSSE